MVEKIWRSISQEFFTTIESMVEDTIQGVTPGFIVSDSFLPIDLFIMHYNRKGSKYVILILAHKHHVYKCKSYDHQFMSFSSH